MTVQTEIVNLTTATTSLLNEVITKKAVLDAAEGKATDALNATNINVAAAKASEVASKTSENNAKTQADRAKTEADRASQISGLSTVAEAIGMAALPLPDVWAPLSDSLRLITGYGRDVLVGSDVVARMVNFSRNSTATYIGKDGQLKTAAANEPRFEKEGLLIEGPSTNLVIRSADMTQSPWGGNTAGTGVLPIVTGNYAVAPDGSQSATRLILNKGAGTTAADAASMICPLNTTVGSTYTVSVWLKSTDGVSQPKVSLSFNGAASANITVTGEWRRYQTTIPSATDASRFPRLQLRGGVGTSDSADLLVWGWQQEALPFASSYIPTAGAAATRAMDKPWIPVKMNEATKVQTCAIEINIPLVNISAYRWILQGSYVSLSMTDSGHIRGWDFAATVGADPTRAGRSVIAQRITDASRSVFNNGVGFTVSNTGVVGGYFPYNTSDLAIGGHLTYALYGHVRNLRIWHRDLSDTQIKAIA